MRLNSMHLQLRNYTCKRRTKTCSIKVNIRLISNVFNDFEHNGKPYLMQNITTSTFEEIRKGNNKSTEFSKKLNNVNGKRRKTDLVHSRVEY